MGADGGAELSRLALLVDVQQQIAACTGDIEVRLRLIADAVRRVTGADAAVVEVRGIGGGPRRAAAGELSLPDAREARSLLVVPLSDGAADRGVLRAAAIREGAFGEQEHDALRLVAVLVGAVLRGLVDADAQADLLTVRALAVSALELRERQLQILFSSAPIGMAVMSGAGDFRKVNPALCALLDRSEAELLALGEHDVTHPADREQARALLLDVTPAAPVSCEKRYQRRDGSSVWCCVTVAVMDGGRLVAQVEDLTVRREARQQLEALARSDALTGLANRLALIERIEDLAARGTPCGLLFLDLDHFKSLNDTYGHEAGDAALKVVAARLRSASRPEDLVARLGGDEFVVVCGGVDAAELDRISRRLERAVASPVYLAGPDVDVRLAASIGRAVSQPGAPAGAALLAEADDDMYAVKRLRQVPPQQLRRARLTSAGSSACADGRSPSR